MLRSKLIIGVLIYVADTILFNVQYVHRALACTKNLREFRIKLHLQNLACKKRESDSDTNFYLCTDCKMQVSC